MRQPHQILAFPYKKNELGKYIYAIFCRADFEQEVWQGISGGVEDNETYLQACKREVNEEAEISYNANILELESITTIPVVNVVKGFLWGKDRCLIYEHCFGIDVTNESIKISHEHNRFEWLEYEEAKNKLKYDSNKTALWELNYKLNN